MNPFNDYPKATGLSLAVLTLCLSTFFSDKSVGSEAESAVTTSSGSIVLQRPSQPLQNCDEAEQALEGTGLKYEITLENGTVCFLPSPL